LRGSVEFGLQFFELPGVGILEGSKLAGNLIIDLADQLLLSLSILGLQRCAQRVEFARRGNLADGQKGDYSTDGGEGERMAVTLGAHNRALLAGNRIDGHDNDLPFPAGPEPVAPPGL